MAAGFLFVSGAGDAGEGTGGAAAGWADGARLLCLAPRHQDGSSHAVVTWSHLLLHGDAALVCAGSDQESTILVRLYSGTQSGALRVKHVSSSAAVLVLHPGIHFGDGAVVFLRSCRTGERDAGCAKKCTTSGAR